MLTFNHKKSICLSIIFIYIRNLPPSSLHRGTAISEPINWAICSKSFQQRRDQFPSWLLPHFSSILFYLSALQAVNYWRSCDAGSLDKLVSISFTWIRNDRPQSKSHKPLITVSRSCTAISGTLPAARVLSWKNKCEHEETKYRQQTLVCFKTWEEQVQEGKRWRLRSTRTGQETIRHMKKVAEVIRCGCESWDRDENTEQCPETTGNTKLNAQTKKCKKLSGIDADERIRTQMRSEWSRAALCSNTHKIDVSLNVWVMHH